MRITVFSAAKKVCVVWAIILGMGAHWAILQSVAWTGMVISYAQHGSFREAMRNTFDGKHPCLMCKAIKAGRQSEQSPDRQRLLLKLDFYILGASGPVLYPPLLEAQRALTCLGSCSEVESPPTPPPLQT